MAPLAATPKAGSNSRLTMLGVLGYRGAHVVRGPFGPGGLGMRRIISISGVICLSFAASFLMASEKPNINFDKGIDNTGIIESARRQGRMRRAGSLHPLLEPKKQPPELEALRLSRAAVIEDVESSKSVEPTGRNDRLPLPILGCDRLPPGKDDPGGGTPSLCVAKPVRSAIGRSFAETKLVPITGPYEPLPRDNPEYHEALVLKEQLGTGGSGLTSDGPNLGVDKGGSIPPPVRDALLTRWVPLDQTRQDLISAARPLDADDEALSRFAVRLNKWLDSLVARRQILDSNASDYNRICLGRRLPDDEFEQCEDFRLRFKACAQAHNASRAEHDRLVGVWQRGKECLSSRGNDFRTRVLNWINQVIRPWIGDARKALENACDRLVSVSANAAPSVILPRGTSALSAVPKYADTGEKPCATTFYWRPDVPTVYGSLNSPRGQAVVFTSFGQRGRQDYRVEATDDFSTKVAGTVVAIEGGRICPVERTYEPEQDKTFCIYKCTIPTTPLTLPGDVRCPEVFE